MVISGNKIIDENYSQQVKQFDKIEGKEFRKLFKEYYETNDPKILNSIVEGFQRIILDVANHFRDNLNTCNLDIMDLIQECNLNLCRALQNKSYNLDSKVKPTTYFYSSFLNALRDYTGYNQPAFTTTPYTMNKVSDVKKYLQDVKEGGNSKQLMKKYKLTDEDIITYAPKSTKSLYDTISNNNENERDTYVIDTIYDDNNEHVEEVIHKEALYQILKDSLKGKDYDILIMKYIQGYTAKEIADKLNIKVNDVYDSCSKSFAKLRTNEKLKELKEMI